MSCVPFSSLFTHRNHDSIPVKNELRPLFSLAIQCPCDRLGSLQIVQKPVPTEINSVAKRRAAIVVKQSIYTLGFFRQCLQHRPTDQCLCCCRHCENKSPTLSRNCGQDISNNSVKWRAVVWVRKTPLLLIQRMWRSVPSIAFVRPYARGDFGTCGSR